MPGTKRKFEEKEQADDSSPKRTKLLHLISSDRIKFKQDLQAACVQIFAASTVPGIKLQEVLELLDTKGVLPFVNPEEPPKHDPRILDFWSVLHTFFLVEPGAQLVARQQPVKLLPLDHPVI